MLGTFTRAVKDGRLFGPSLGRSTAPEAGSRCGDPGEPLTGRGAVPWEWPPPRTKLPVLLLGSLPARSQRRGQKRPVCVYLFKPRLLEPSALQSHLRDVRGPRKENQPARPCCPTGPDRMMKRDFTRTSTRESVQAMSVTCYSDRLSPRKVGSPRRGDSLRCASVRPVPPPLNESSSLSCTVSCCG